MKKCVKCGSLMFKLEDIEGVYYLCANCGYIESQVEKKEVIKMFKVMRDCCLSGNCIICHELKYGRKVRVLQIDHLSKRRAREVAHNWREYHATVEEE